MNYRRLIFSFLIFSSSFFIYSNLVHASTTINTDITEDAIWVLEHSPYVVESNITVLPGITLTVEPGVVVKFDGTGMDVLGDIIAGGTDAQPIYFTSFYDDEISPEVDDEEFCYENIDEEGNTIGEICEIFDFWDPYVGDWGGLYLQDSTDSSFKNVFFRYADTVLTLNASSVDLENIEIKNSRNGLVVFGASLIGIFGGNFDNLNEALSIFDNSSLYMSGSSISNSTNGLTIFNNSYLTLSDFSITCDHDGIAVFNSSRLELSKGYVSCGHDGVVLFNEVETNIDDVRIANARDAGVVAFNQADAGFVNEIEITNSEIVENENGFVVFGTGISVHQSSIYNNNLGGVVAFSPLDPNQFDFTNNYWGDVSGPYNSVLNPGGLGNEVSDNVLFEPFLASDPLSEVECCSSVLFLPGLQASRLYKEKSILGISVEDQLWEPNVNSDVEALYLNADGTSKNSGIYTRDIIQETNSPVSLGFAGMNIYKSFSSKMSDLVDDFIISNWTSYAYDWRQSVEDIVNNGTDYENGTVSLVDTLQSLVNSSKNGKVTIIGHSNGGILAKALLKKLQDDKNAGVNNLIDSVDVLILVAVPEIGTPKAMAGMLHGYGQEILGGWILGNANARELGRNMLSAFGLLPSKEYINRVSASPATFVDTAIPSNVTTKMVQTFGGAISSYDEYKSFLFGGDGRTNPPIAQTNLPINLSQSLFTQAESLHDRIDAFTPPESLRVIEVAGWGLETLASFEYSPICGGSSSVICQFTLDQRPRFTVDGDGTVVVPSAQYMSFLGNTEKYWLNLEKINEDKFRLFPSTKHANILEPTSVFEFLSNIIQEVPVTNLQYFSDTVPIDTKDRFRLSIHSPVTLDAYDAEGNHTGKVCPPDSEFCYIEENIVNSSYLEFGEGKYLNIPEDKMFKIKLQGTDIGTFTYESEKVSPSGASTISTFVDIPVTTQTQAEIVLNQTTQNPELKLDVTGDGVVDFTLLPSATFDPIAYLQIMKATINSLDLPQAKKTAFNRRVDNIIKSIQKGKIDKAKLKADKFKSALEKKLSKPDPKKIKPKKLSKTDAQLLLDMLNKLLDNIS